MRDLKLKLRDLHDSNTGGKKNNGSWVNLKGGGQFATKTGNGQQMCGMVSGLGSVIGLPSKEGFMIMISRNFARLLMMGIFLTSVPGYFGDEGVCSFGFKTGRRHCFLFWVGGEEKVTQTMEFEL